MSTDTGTTCRAASSEPFKASADYEGRSEAAATALSWTRLPALPSQAYDTLYDDLHEAESTYDADERKGMALWLRHCLRLGLVTEHAVRSALSASRPFTALDRLYAVSCNTLAERLNACVHAHLPPETSYGGGIQVRLAMPNDWAPTSVDISVELPRLICVGSLHALPKGMGRLVNRALSLLRAVYVQCHLPRDVLNSYHRWQTQTLLHEYKILREAVGVRHIKRAAAFIRKQGHFHFFSSDPDHLARQLATARRQWQQRTASDYPSFSSDYLWFHDEEFDEYMQIRSAVGVGNIERAAAYLGKKRHAFFFSSDPDALTEQLARMAILRAGPAPWMRESSPQGAVTEARSLATLVHQYRIERGEHAWLDFVAHVCECVTASFSDDRAVRRELRYMARYHNGYEDGQDGQVGLENAFMVTSGTQLEAEHYGDIADHMMNAGEHMSERYCLDGIASARLYGMLERFATGVGLLLQAAATEDQVVKGRLL